MGLTPSKPEQYDISDKISQNNADTEKIQQNEANIDELISYYVHDLNTDILLVFNEDEDDIQDQILVLPHEEGSIIGEYTKQYNLLKRDRNIMDKLINKELEEIKNLKKRISGTKEDITKIVVDKEKKNKKNINDMETINKDLKIIKDQFANLINTYSPNTSSSMLEDKFKEKILEDMKKLQKVTQPATKSKVDVSISVPVPATVPATVPTVPAPVPAPVPATEPTVPATVPTLSATAPTVPATTGGSKSNEEFKEDPLDYVFEKYMDNLKELSKYWGIKYNKNEKKTLKLLKIALKCKNNMKITSKEMKILAKNIGLSKTKTNIETLKEKLQNVPIIN
tara:strand:- start:85 stop:1101 length:1017 start_codon:yes stop_codon:yes gene_type:complete